MSLYEGATVMLNGEPLGGVVSVELTEEKAASDATLWSPSFVSTLAMSFSASCKVATESIRRLIRGLERFSRACKRGARLRAKRKRRGAERACAQRWIRALHRYDPSGTASAAEVTKAVREHWGRHEEWLA